VFTGVKFRVVFGMERFLKAVSAAKTALSMEDLDDAVVRLMAKTVEDLKNLTPPKGRGRPADERLKGKTRLWSMWKMDGAEGSGGAPGARRRPDRSQGLTIRHRIVNETKFRPLLRWLESGTASRSSRAAKNIFAGSRRNSFRTRGIAAKGVKQTGKVNLYFPASAFPNASRMAPNAGGGHYYLFSDVQRRGIRATSFFKIAMRNFERRAERVREDLVARFNNAVKGV